MMILITERQELPFDEYRLFEQRYLNIVILR